MSGGDGANGGAGDAVRGATASPICDRGAGMDELFGHGFGIGTAIDEGVLPPAVSSILFKTHY